MRENSPEELYKLEGLEPLVCWYRDHKRSMPWREAAAPYHVWLSEIMLQQTRVEAVKAYFNRFTERLPDIGALAAVPEDELLKLWEGLGYYNRARNLKKAAVIMVERYDGELPADYDLLMKLPGIGSYTAGAVASIAYGLCAPAVDGNVLRVMMRYLDCFDDVMRASVKKKLERSIMAVMPRDCPGEFNQALMELGETVCIPNGMPLCGECPLQNRCGAYRAGHERELPVRQKKKERRTEERTVMIFARDEQVALVKRDDRGLLAGLWEFPSLTGIKSLPQIKKWMAEQGIEVRAVRRLGRAKHVFSHVEWHMAGYRADVCELPAELIPGFVWAGREELTGKYAIPTAFRYYLDQILEE